MLNRRYYVDVVRLYLVTATTTVLTKMIGGFFEPQGEDKLKLSVHHFLFDHNLNHPCRHQSQPNHYCLKQSRACRRHHRAQLPGGVGNSATVDSRGSPGALLVLSYHHLSLQRMGFYDRHQICSCDW